MQRIIAFILFLSLGLTACSGQGTFSVDFKTSTPAASTGATPTSAAGRTSTPAARMTPTTGAQTQEQPPAPASGQETSADKVSPDVIAFIQIQLVGQTIVNPPRVFVVQEDETEVETKYMQEFNTRGWHSLSSSSGLGGKTKVMVMEKAKTKTHIFIVPQSNTETLIYVVTTTG